jgi:hypothetical protein
MPSKDEASLSIRRLNEAVQRAAWADSQQLIVRNDSILIGTNQAHHVLRDFIARGVKTRDRSETLPSILELNANNIARGIQGNVDGNRLHQGRLIKVSLRDKI